MWDSVALNPQAGVVYSDNNFNDGRVTDPSKLYGWQNQLHIDFINTLSFAIDLKQNLIYKYQQQNFMKNTFIIQFGYSIAI
jgi:hypothetical protein